MLVIKSPDHREIPAISEVRPAEKLCIMVTWSRGPRAPKTEKIDLSPLVNSLKIYKPLRNNRALFETVHLLDEGGDIIAWGDDDAIDMDSLALEELARDMMTAEDFKALLNTLQFTHLTAGAMLGYSRRHIENFLSGAKPVPRVCSLACAALRVRYERSETEIASHRIRFVTGGAEAQTTVPTTTNAFAVKYEEHADIVRLVYRSYFDAVAQHSSVHQELLEGDTGSVIVDQPTHTTKRISAASFYVQ